MKVTKSKKGEDLSDLRFVPLEHIIKHAELKNRDIDKDHVAELKASILASGLDTPLQVWDGEGGPGSLMKLKGEKLPATFLIAGGHRKVALREIQEENPTFFKKHFAAGIPVSVFHGDLNDAIAAQLRENVARKNPTAAEVLPHIKKLLANGKKKSEIAKMIGKSKAWVTTTMQVAELGDEDFEKGDIGLQEGRAAVKKVKSGKMSKEEAREEAKQKTSKKKAKGAKRQDKRIGLKKLWAAYNGLPNTKLGVKITILEGIIQYNIGETDELPEEIDISADEEDDDGGDKKKSKKHKKNK